MPERKRAILAFEDGSVFRGWAFGASKTIVGEAVFNTSMTGYQEILTDPSYFGQIVTMTAPHIGNYGTNPEDEESDGPKVSGFVVRELSPITSNWRSKQDLNSYLKENNIPGIEGIDTRTITLKLRNAGVMKACLSTKKISEKEAIKQAKDWKGLDGLDLVKEVTCKKVYVFKPEPYETDRFSVTGTNLYKFAQRTERFNAVALDFGVKRSSLRKLYYQGFNITVVPAHTTAHEIRDLNPDAIFLSNGPGDPSAVTYAHKTVKELIQEYPTFGICMGHQVITHALGGSTFKLKFGHRGANHPVKNFEKEYVAITSQNHGYATDQSKLEACGAIITELNLNDSTVSGLRLKTLPVFSVQYHPEAGPGPNDADNLFNDFYQLVAKTKKSSFFTPSTSNKKCAC